MYFSNFPIIPYDSVGQGKFKDVTNLLRRVALRSKVKSNVLLFDTYDVQEGETPESIADKLYDDPELHWIILMVNDITDRYHQWPMNYSQFLQYINDKYVNADGTSNVDGVHHYEIAQSSGNTDTKIEVYNNSALFTSKCISLIVSKSILVCASSPNFKSVVNIELICPSCEASTLIVTVSVAPTAVVIPSPPAMSNVFPSAIV